jgi:bifunctional DNase/RNase
MKKIKLEIVGLSYSQKQSGAYALVLGEAKGKRRLPIIIGGFEAQAIAIELEKMAPSRPLTHDLFKTFSDNFNISINEVIIYNLVEGIFFAKLIATNGDKEIEIDARTSDAIALALRFGCPVYTFEFILSTAGIILDDDSKSSLLNPAAEEEESLEPKAPQSEFSALTLDELQQQMNDALGHEDYEKASRIRDEIAKRGEK